MLCAFYIPFFTHFPVAMPLNQTLYLSSSLSICPPHPSSIVTSKVTPVTSMRQILQTPVSLVSSVKKNRCNKVIVQDLRLQLDSNHSMFIEHDGGSGPVTLSRGIWILEERKGRYLIQTDWFPMPCQASIGKYLCFETSLSPQHHKCFVCHSWTTGLTSPEKKTKEEGKKTGRCW